MLTHVVRKRLPEWQCHRSKSCDGYGWGVGKLLALGLIDTGEHEIGTELKIEILGEMFKTAVIEESPYDPQKQKLRA